LIPDYVWAPQKRNNIITCGKIRVHTSYLYTRKTKSTQKKMDLLTLTLYMILIDHPLLCCCCSVSKLTLILCNPIDYSIPGSSVLHYLLEFAQIHVHLTMSFSVLPFSSCIQSFPASGFFPVSQFFVLGGLRISASDTASVLPVNIQG